MKNFYRVPARYQLKLFPIVLLIILFALSPAKTFAQVTSITLNSVKIESDNSVYTASSSFIPGQSFVVYFSSVATGSNNYIVQISDNTGSFSPSPLTISAAVAYKMSNNITSANAKMLCTIPLTTAAGNYSIRVSNNPSSVTSSPVSISVSDATAGFGIGTGVNGSAVSTFNLTPAMCGTHFYSNNGSSNVYMELNANTSPQINSNNTATTPAFGAGSGNGSSTILALVPPSGYKLVLTYNTFDIFPDGDGGFDDNMQVFNGPDNSSPQFGGEYGAPSSPGPFTSTDATGAITVDFVTDNSDAAAGWDATISYIVPAPTGSATQTVCSGATLADLTASVATGAGVNWYDAAAPGGSLLPGNTPVVNGTHYFASQTAGTCESTDRLDVTANVGVAAPVATAGTGATGTQITANWNTVSGATGYFLDVSTSNGFGSFVSGYNNLSVGNVLTENVTGLTAGMTYFYRVRETNGTCTSISSNTISYATTGSGVSCPFIGGTISTPFVIICSGTTTGLTVSGSTGNNYQWQISSDNTSWSDISGATTTSYTTAGIDGNSNKFYRLMSKSAACWNVTSNTAEVDVSNPTISVTASNITDQSVTLNWSPTGSGNYQINYSGASSGLQTSVTPAKTITGLSANGSYTFTVTQNSPVGCSATGTLSGVKTLCAMPTGVTLSTPGNDQIQVSWNGTPGADYRVYYRPLFSYISYFTQDVNNASSVLLTKQGGNNLYGGTTYEVYVAILNCSGPGTVGQPTSPVNVTTTPAQACTPVPLISSVTSVCPVQIEVFMAQPGNYNIYIQRITPTVLAVNSYEVNGNYFTVSVPYSGDQYLIAADLICSSGISNLYVYPGNVSIKPQCTAPANLVLSNPTCHGFTASWNADQCLSNTASGYDVYERVAGTISYNSYGTGVPGGGVGPSKQFSILAPGRTYQVFVKSIYNCDGYVTFGPSSQIQTITTPTSGCRDEDDQPQETKPATQQYSPDNSEIFSLYPNPNNGEFIVDLSRLNSNEDAVRIEVINLIGQTVLTHLTTISDGHMNEYINLPHGTAAGTYIVRLTAGKSIYTAKINVSK